MGVFRFFLAYVVLISHCPVGELNRWFHPALAVQCFFIISGFYMQLLVSEKYAGQDPTKFYKDFYLSRIFRIFPVYWVILLITIIVTESAAQWCIQKKLSDKEDIFPLSHVNKLRSFIFEIFFY